MKSSKDKMSVTVGIPTCYGDPSILETVKSLRESHPQDVYLPPLQPAKADVLFKKSGKLTRSLYWRTRS